MATLTQVRTGLKRTLQSINGLHVYSIWPDNLIAPFVIARRQRSNKTTFSSNGAFHFELTVGVQFNTLEKAQEALAEYTDFGGTKSIIAALEDDETLANYAEYLIIGDWAEDQSIVYPENGPEYLSAVLPLEVNIVY